MPDGPLIEPRVVFDVFVNSMGPIETLPGGCLRFTLAVTQTGSDGAKERIVVCKLVVPKDLADQFNRRTREFLG